MMKLFIIERLHGVYIVFPNNRIFLHKKRIRLSVKKRNFIVSEQQYASRDAHSKRSRKRGRMRSEIGAITCYIRNKIKIKMCNLNFHQEQPFFLLVVCQTRLINPSVCVKSVGKILTHNVQKLKLRNSNL